MAGLVIGTVLGLAVVFVLVAAIRADARAEDAHDRWMKSPDRTWNQHRSTDTEGGH